MLYYMIYTVDKGQGQLVHVFRICTFEAHILCYIDTKTTRMAASVFHDNISLIQNVQWVIFFNIR